MTNGRFAVYRNVFALIVVYGDYEGETHLQTKRATYMDIRAWVKQHGLHVSSLAISWTKDLCGLAKVQHKGPITPEKANAIREAFRWFGIIKSEKKGGRVAALCAVQKFLNHLQSVPFISACIDTQGNILAKSP